jgi:hypothetical protein
MTLATKNGSLIVKDGQIAENCGCCGEWYCCMTSRDETSMSAPCQLSSLLDSVTVTIGSVQDYIAQSQIVDRACSIAPYSVKHVSIVPSSAYAGTHTLTQTTGNILPNQLLWRHDFPADGAGCSSYITLTVTQNTFGLYTWDLSLFYRRYFWQKNARSLPSETKSLSDMKCIGTTTGSHGDCSATSFEEYGASTGTASIAGQQSPCKIGEDISYAIGLTPYPFSLSSDEKSGLSGGGGQSSTSTAGSLSLPVRLVIMPK